MEQLRLCAEGRKPCLLPREAKALLTCYEVLSDTVRGIAREGDPCTATQDWSTPERFAEWAIEQARNVVEQIGKGSLPCQTNC
jgi:hypothetical protein